MSIYIQKIWYNLNGKQSGNIETQYKLLIQIDLSANNQQNWSDLSAYNQQNWSVKTSCFQLISVSGSLTVLSRNTILKVGSI